MYSMICRVCGRGSRGGEEQQVDVAERGERAAPIAAGGGDRDAVGLAVPLATGLPTGLATEFVEVGIPVGQRVIEQGGDQRVGQDAETPRGDEA